MVGHNLVSALWRFGSCRCPHRRRSCRPRPRLRDWMGCRFRSRPKSAARSILWLMRVDRQPHPTHARFTRSLIAALFAMAAITWIAGYHAQESMEDQFLVNALVLIFMISGGCLMLAMVARDKLSRCPRCKCWLRSKGQASEGGTRIFACVRCGIDWDARVPVSGAGEG